MIISPNWVIISYLPPIKGTRKLWTPPNQPPFFLRKYLPGSSSAYWRHSETHRIHGIYLLPRLKSNMEPENQPLEKEIPNLETIISRFHVKLQGCIFRYLIYHENQPTFRYIDIPWILWDSLFFFLRSNLTCFLCIDWRRLGFFPQHVADTFTIFQQM